MRERTAVPAVPGNPGRSWSMLKIVDHRDLGKRTDTASMWFRQGPDLTGQYGSEFDRRPIGDVRKEVLRAIVTRLHLMIPSLSSNACPRASHHGYSTTVNLLNLEWSE